MSVGAGSTENAVTAAMVEANRRVCVGSGMCVAIAPGAFELGEDRKVQVRNPLVDTELDDLLDADDGCPVSAITIHANHSQGN